MDGASLLAAGATFLTFPGTLESWAHHPALIAIMLLVILTSERAVMLTPGVARALGWVGGRSKMAPSL